MHLSFSFYFDSAAPDAPLPTRPPEPTKQTKLITVATKKSTEKEPETILLTDEVKTKGKPTPRLLFSLPDHITDFDILKRPIKTTQKSRMQPQSPTKTGKC